MPWYTTDDARRDAAKAAAENKGKARKQACEECPFREHSQMRYDADAMEALDKGNEPYCHKMAGLDSIFRDAPLRPSEHSACHGFHAWIKRHKGFRKPRAI